mmetsp:Transcript_17222/g.31192  ORF Transcript_17222/g.31192 Transcript_17222/m.31192 type:complete len:96 (+) Transcript_17222:806-1093(+)
MLVSCVLYHLHPWIVLKDSILKFQDPLFYISPLFLSHMSTKHLVRRDEDWIVAFLCADSGAFVLTDFHSSSICIMYELAQSNTRQWIRERRAEEL